MQDILNDVLKMLRLSGTVYFQMNFGNDWGMKMEKGKFSQFHIVTKGKCLVKTPTMQKPICVNEGDIIAFPHGDAHWIADTIKSKKCSGQLVYEAFKKNEMMFETKLCNTSLVCGHFEFDTKLEHPFLKNLPPIIHFLGNKQQSQIQAIVSSIVEETNTEGFASNLITDRLAEVLFIYLLRDFVKNNKDQKAPWTALNDQQIYNALQIIHLKFSNSLTLASIAREIGMSRSLFAVRFRNFVGTTPIEYLTRWRMLNAKELLLKTDYTINTIAEKVGYFSEPAFNRAFKRQLGQTPGNFRKTNV